MTDRDKQADRARAQLALQTVAYAFGVPAR
jgi:hypothetical protein